MRPLKSLSPKAVRTPRKHVEFWTLKEEEARLQQEIADLLAKAQAADAGDDVQFGDRHGDELPDELARR